MLFVCSRTSVWNDGKPCDEANKMAYMWRDEHPFDDPSKMPDGLSQLRDRWYEEGKNHRVENGHIVREFEDSRWFVEIKDLSELLEFTKKHGDLVVSRRGYNPEYMHIEIYDDYRE